MKLFIIVILACSIHFLRSDCARAQNSTPPVLRQAATSRTTVKTTSTSPENTDVNDGDVVRVSTNLITVPAEVMDRNGRYIGSLRREDFRVYENGVEQELAYFASVEQPFTVALLLDVSGSTQSQLQAIRTAANTFISRLRPRDRLLIVSFDGQINLMTEAVTLSELRQKKLRLDAVHDGTVLYDAISFALKERLAQVQGRKAIVVLTDGVDQGSRNSSYKETIGDAEESDTLIYSVQYNTLPQLPERLSKIENSKTRERIRSRLVKEYAIGSTYLRTLSEKTGGRVYNADTLSDIPQAFTAITEELGRQYSLGYYPKTRMEAGEKRDISVRVRQPNLIVHARESYITNGSLANKAGQ